MHSDLVDDLLVTFEGENVSPWYRGNLGLYNCLELFIFHTSFLFRL